jgi:hypothetical protein
MQRSSFFFLPHFTTRVSFVHALKLGRISSAIGRFDFWFNHDLFYPGLDLLIVLRMARDWAVDGRVHKVYVWALPPANVLHAFVVYVWRAIRRGGRGSPARLWVGELPVAFLAESDLA